MTKALATSPFDSNRYVGSVIYVSPEIARMNLPYAASVSEKQYAGYPVNGGQVGEFVFIESDDHAILGRITEVRLPDGERLNAEPKLGIQTDAHPIGMVQLLTTLELSTGRVLSGIAQHPRIGQHVYSAHPLLVKHVIEGSSLNKDECIELATSAQSSNIKVNVTPDQLIGRHCAVLGTTGGGKSWTVARIAQEIARIGGKVILIDPTGEFHTFKENTKSVYLGGDITEDADQKNYVGFPYWMLTELDLFTIFQPSGASQTPKLREALLSLKISYAENREKSENIVKRNGSKKDFRDKKKKFAAAIADPAAPYLINLLPQQIVEECVWESGGSAGNANHEFWGNSNEQVRGYCETLVSKINSIINSKALKCLFEPNAFNSLTDEIDEFLKSDQKILRVSMENLSFEFSARELLVNAIGRYLLGIARLNNFLENPTVVILDEAHQFLNKNLGDENNRIALDAFGLIAKEGRKYGLTTILATQRPRDIPDDVLSQMGMFVVHRLINDRDRQVVEKACGNLDGSAAAFLPTLGQGEAILVGVNFPMPTPVKIIEPLHKPKSEGPMYSKFWISGLGENRS
jgi:DNA helicase HerA-like ATPase